MTPAAIALGSNLGDRRANLAAALTHLAELPGTGVVRVSPFIETAPVAPADAEGPVGGLYLNGVALLETSIAPRALLDQLLRIEHELGRVRHPANRWGERTIDLDLLLYGDLVVSEPGLVIPHPRLHLRRFVLIPLAHVAPGWVVPTLGRTVAELSAALPPSLTGESANNLV